MPEAVRVGDLTAHSMPMKGSGSPDVLIGNMKAWRAMPEGAGAGLDEASKSVKEIMDKPVIRPPDVMPKLPEIAAKMAKVAGQAGAAGATGVAAVPTAFTTLASTAAALVATYTAAAAVPGGEPAAAQAFTIGFQTALAQTMDAAVKAMAGPWDMDTCAQAGTAGPHGSGLVIKGCKTVFINNLPAVMKGQQVIEASGGPAAIQMGCGTVFIGDKAPSSGGGKSSANKSSSSSSSTKPRASSGTGGAATQPESADQSSDVEKKPELDDLWVRIAMKPEDAGSDTFVLAASDGSFSASKSAHEDKIPNNDSIDLLFEKLDISKSYTLEVTTPSGSFKLFEDVPYADLESLDGESNASDESSGDDDLGTDSGPVEAVRPHRPRR